LLKTEEVTGKNRNIIVINAVIEWLELSVINVIQRINNIKKHIIGIDEKTA
jgi:hypothetical protein